MDVCTNSGGIHIPSEILGNEDWFKKLVEDQNWVIDIDNRAISKGDWYDDSEGDQETA